MPLHNRFEFLRFIGEFAHLLLQGTQFLLQYEGTGIPFLALVIEGIVTFDMDILFQIADAQIVAMENGAMIRLQFMHKQAHKRRLPRAIHPDDTDLLAFFYQKGHVLQNRMHAIALIQLLNGHFCHAVLISKAVGLLHRAFDATATPRHCPFQIPCNLSSCPCNKSG